VESEERELPQPPEPAAAVFQCIKRAMPANEALETLGGEAATCFDRNGVIAAKAKAELHKS